MENKKLSKKALIGIVCTAVVLIAVALTITFCALSKDSGISSIVIKDTDLPRTTYVQGQDLDLSDGVITAIGKKSESVIPMTDSGVSVSGYDKNTLGKQTVTVSYKDLTTTFEVNVLSRITAEGYKAEYFIGDSFDKNTGKIKLVKDDGKTTTIPFSSDYVTLKTFNNTAAGDVSVTISYDDTNGTKFDASFTVKFYEVGEILSLVKPSKTIYYSHDSLDVQDGCVKGGYIQVKAKGADYTANVSITPEMISGFNPSLANATHTNKSPLTQTLTCTYGGQSKTFTISVIYSSVSLVKDAAESLANVTITGSDFVLGDELAQLAITAATKYFELTNVQKAYITEEESTAVMRPAAISVTKAFATAAEVYANIFVIDSNSGDILINAQSKNDLETLKGNFNTKDDLFSVYADLLNNMKTSFKDIVLYTEEDDKGEEKEVTIDTYVKAPNKDQRTFYKSLFDHMITVSNKLNSIPEDWSMDPASPKYLDNYKTYIADIFNTIINSRYAGPSFHGPYNSISAWRGNDFYEIFYRYYLEIADDDTKANFIKKSFQSQSGFTFPLPSGEIQTWYNYLNAAYQQITKGMVVTNPTDGSTQYLALYDTTLFMYYYNEVIDLANGIMNGTNELEKTVYTVINGDMMIYNYLEAPYYTDSNGNVHPNGYLYFVSIAPDSKNLTNLRKAYMEIMTMYFDKELNLGELEAHKDKFAKMFDELSKLTPTELYAFISSVSFLYGASDEFVLDYTDRIYSYFTLLSYYYESQFIENTELLPFRQLLKAMEICAQIGAKSTVEDFRLAMGELEAMMTGTDLSQADKDAFLAIAGDCYNKYLGISKTLSAPTDFGGYESEYNELKETIKNYFVIYNRLSAENLSAEDAKYYILLFALSEKAVSLHEYITENAPGEVVNALYTVKYALNGTEEMTMETAFAFLSSNLYGQMLNQSISVNSGFPVTFWAVYSTSVVREFLVSLADPLMAYYNGETVTVDDVKDIMAKFRTFNVNEKTLFDRFDSVKLDNNVRGSLYSDMILDVFTANNSAIKDFVKNLVQAEYMHAVYITDPTDENRITYFSSAMKSVISSYTALGTAQNTLDNVLKEMYQFYLDVYESIDNIPSDSDNAN